MPKRLSNAELYYLQQNPDNLDAKELAKELGFHENIIKKYMKPKVHETPPGEKQEVRQEKKKIPPDQDAYAALGKRTSGEKNAGGVVVMTPGASQIGDEARKNLPSIRESLKNAIHKPRG